MILVPRLVQVWISGLIIAACIIVGTVQAIVVGHVVGPFAAVVLGALISPAMLRGAHDGRLRPLVAWVIAAVGVAVPVLATLELDSTHATYLSVSWYACGVLAGAMLVWMARRRVAALVGITGLVVQTVCWAGPIGFLRLGVAAEILLLTAMLLIYRTIRVVADAADEAAAEERRLISWEAEQDALRLERSQRLVAVGRSALPLLGRVLEQDCDLDERTAGECRLLEQTVRDEIRGRRLLNDDVRTVLLAHRRRGATVRVLDDGGLDDMRPDDTERVLDDLAEQLRPLRSERIVIRTADPASGSALTVVATSSNPQGSDGCLDCDDDTVDLWTSIARPAGQMGRADELASSTVGRQRSEP